MTEQQHTNEQHDDKTQTALDYLRSLGFSDEPSQPQCTCEDFQKQRALCPVCDKEKYEKFVKDADKAKQPKAPSNEQAIAKLLFDKTARAGLRQWDIEKFKKSHPKLFAVIIQSIIFSKQSPDKKAVAEAAIKWAIQIFIDYSIVTEDEVEIHRPEIDKETSQYLSSLNNTQP